MVSEAIESKYINDGIGHQVRCGVFELEYPPREQRNRHITILDVPFYRDRIEEFREHVRAMGMSDQTVRAHVNSVCRCLYAIQTMSPRTSLKDIGEDDIGRLKESMSDLTEETSRTYLHHFGRFMRFSVSSDVVDRCIPMNKGYRDFPWYYGKLGEFRFDEELNGYTETLRNEGMRDGTIENREFTVRICCRILDHERGIDKIGSIDADCIQLLDGCMRELTNTTRKYYLSIIGDFVLRNTGWNPYRDYLQKLDGRLLFNPVTPEAKDFKVRLDAYISDMESRGAKIHTKRSIRNSVAVCYETLTEEYGPVDINEVDRYMFRFLRFRMERTHLDGTTESEGRKQSTVKKYLKDFDKFIRFTCGHTPYKDADLIWGEEGTRRKFIFLPEMKRMLEKADEESYLILTLGSGMGLRRSEIADIKLNDIGADGYLTVRGKGHGVEGKVVRIRMPRQILDAIDRYKKVRQSIIDEYGDYSQGNLLVRSHIRKGCAYTAECVTGTIESLMKRCGVDMTTHSMRRLFATTLYDRGTDLDTLRRAMRHSDIRTTMTCYLNADPRKMAKVTDEVNDILFGTPEGASGTA